MIFVTFLVSHNRNNIIYHAMFFCLHGAAAGQMGRRMSVWNRQNHSTCINTTQASTPKDEQPHSHITPTLTPQHTHLHFHTRGSTSIPQHPTCSFTCGIPHPHPTLPLQHPHTYTNSSTTAQLHTSTFRHTFACISTSTNTYSKHLHTQHTHLQFHTCTSTHSLTDPQRVF